MKYLVLTKCRLIDRSVYLIPGTVFAPDSEEYERTSRSLAAALRTGWIRKATDDEIEQYEKELTKKLAAKPVVKPVTKPSVGDAPLGAVDMKPEDLADEVISGKDIMTARDKRRAEASRTASSVEVKTETADSIKGEIETKVRRKKEKLSLSLKKKS